MLLDAGADPSATNSFGIFPLRTVAMNWHEKIEVFKTILEAVQDVDQKTTEGNTVLGLLCKEYIESSATSTFPVFVTAALEDQERILERIKLLIFAGANIDADTKWIKKWRSPVKKEAYKTLMNYISLFENSRDQLLDNGYRSDVVLYDYEI